MRLKLLLEDTSSGKSHKLWVECQEFSYISEFANYLSELFELRQDLDLYSQDFFLHPDLPFLGTLQDSDLVTVKYSVYEPKLEEKQKKPSKNFRKQMKKTPKMLQFTGQKTKFSSAGKIESVSAIQPSIRLTKSKKILTRNEILPHALSAGDLVEFTTKNSSCIMVICIQSGVVSGVESRSVTIGLYEEPFGEDFSSQASSRAITVNKGDFHSVVRLTYM